MFLVYIILLDISVFVASWFNQTTQFWENYFSYLFICFGYVFYIVHSLPYVREKHTHLIFTIYIQKKALWNLWLYLKYIMSKQFIKNLLNRNVGYFNQMKIIINHESICVNMSNSDYNWWYLLIIWSLTLCGLLILRLFIVWSN